MWNVPSQAIFKFFIRDLFCITKRDDVIRQSLHSCCSMFDLYWDLFYFGSVLIVYFKFDVGRKFHNLCNLSDNYGVIADNSISIIKTGIPLADYKIIALSVRLIIFSKHNLEVGPVNSCTQKGKLCTSDPCRGAIPSWRCSWWDQTFTVLSVGMWAQLAGIKSHV